MSELLRKACVEARKHNSSIKQQVRDIGSNSRLIPGVQGLSH